MAIVLTLLEIRLLGCLVEKEATTPENYPLSLNALTNACNQKTNRDPVMNLAESTVQSVVDGLVKKALIVPRSSAGGRVPKYAHRLRDRLRPEFDFSREELAPMCELMLRGPQTLNELRTRCARLHEYADFDELAAALKSLEQRPEGPYLKCLARGPGQKEARYAHLLAGELPAESEGVADEAAPRVANDETTRLSELELAVRSLRGEFEALSKRVEELFVAR